MMDEAARAKRIASIIQERLEQTPEVQPAGAATAAWPIGVRFIVTRRGGCAACDPGACSVCGYLFTGENIEINHCTHGRRTLSDRAVHYLSHGMTRYPTAYVVRGETVDVTLDLEELAGYLDL
jgi:hypothetical protein